LTLPAIRADVPHRFAVHGRNDGLAGAALALADTGILRPEHWQGDLREAVSTAISDLAHKHLPNPLADYTLVLAEDTVAANLEYDTSHGYQASRKLPANTRVSALIVTFNLDNVVHRVIGPAIQRMEGAHRGLGQTVLYWLHTAFNHSSSALDPIAGYGWAQYNYWMGENDETAREEEELEYLRAEHENEQKREAFDEAVARRQLQFFRKADYDRAIPLWAGSGFKHHPMLTLEQLARHRRGRFRPVIDATLAAANLVPKLQINDVSCFELCRSVMSPYLLRWYCSLDRNRQDPLAQIYDDYVNELYQSGEDRLDVSAVFAWHDPRSLVDAMERFAQWLQLLNGAEHLLGAIAPRNI
jgi:PRTRC genetic system protein F